MAHSLQGRLIALLVLLIAAALAAGVLMLGLFRQSASAQVAAAEARTLRSCDAIAAAFRFYTAGLHEPSAAIETAAFRRGLPAVVQTALRERTGIEGGIWSARLGSLAYAYPTYEGSGPKTDLPQAEAARIRDINTLALREDHPQSSRYQAASQTLLLAACPLAGPASGFTAWTMTRVFTFAGRAYGQLMSGLIVLLATVIAAAVLLARLQLTWSRHVARIEEQLGAHEIGDLPELPATGERELDRVLLALNQAGARLSAARKRAGQLSRQVATGERLAAIGRTAANIAHEIRNPMAVMRLQAENALAQGPERCPEALSGILAQIERLDRLLRRLLSVTEPETLQRQYAPIAAVIDASVAAHQSLASGKGLVLETHVDVGQGWFDPRQIRSALDNLILNAIQAAPAHSRIDVGARREGESLLFFVTDQGPGAPEQIREELFEPFVTGRPEGTGLGLSIVREVARSHGGAARYLHHPTGSTFELSVPWQPS